MPETEKEPMKFLNVLNLIVQNWKILSHLLGKFDFYKIFNKSSIKDAI